MSPDAAAAVPGPAPTSSHDRLVFDCLSAALLMLVAILGAYLPKYLASRGSLQHGTASSLAFHLGNMLSGGVMLSAGFCHLLADALRQLAFVGRFPMAPFLSAVGYLTTLLADQLVQMLTTDADGGGSAADGASPHPGDYRSPPPAYGNGADGTPSPAAGLGGWVMGRGSKAWGYSRLGDTQQGQQQLEGQLSFEDAYGDGAPHTHHGNGAAIELAHHASSAAAEHLGGRSASSHGLSRAGTAAAAAAGGGSLAQRHSAAPSVLQCCHNPATCPCCSSGSPGRQQHCSSRAAAGEAEQGAGRSLNPSLGQGGHARRPGSAGGLARAGSSLSAVARTRSLTGPLTLPSPLAAAPAAAAAATAADGGAEAPPSPRTAAAAAGAIEDDTPLCVLASGSPRAVSAAGLRPRSPVVFAAMGLAAQPRQEGLGVSAPAAAPEGPESGGHRAGGPADQQQHSSNGNSCCNGSHKQPQQHGDSEPADGRHAAGGDRAQQQPHPGCCCCCGGVGGSSAAGGGGGSIYRSGSAQPGMTEACSVARVAGHLELEVMSTTTGGGHNHAHFQVFLSHRPLSFATSLLLASALCIHSILEGLALGAQQSMQATEDIMLAIAAHKGLAAYALGASIVESKASDSKFWLVVCLFAAATPLGIGIGYASSVLGHGPVSAAMSALASGTFLYVALNEVIPKELEHPDGHRLAKVAALLLGFGLMSLLAVWA